MKYRLDALYDHIIDTKARLCKYLDSTESIPSAQCCEGAVNAVAMIRSIEKLPPETTVPSVHFLFRYTSKKALYT